MLVVSKATPPLLRFWSMVSPGPREECWLWRGVLKSTGYGQLGVGGSRSGRDVQAHRFSFEAFVGPITPGLWVLHRCDVKACVNPWHLYLGTREQNTRDAVERGLFSRGETRWNAKLTVAQVLAIRSDDRPHARVASDYGVVRRTISQVKSRKSWSWLA